VTLLQKLWLVLPLGPELPVFWSEQNVSDNPCCAAVGLKRKNRAVACINLKERPRFVLKTLIVDYKK
jgi:hypothetical protein